MRQHLASCLCLTLLSACLLRSNPATGLGATGQLLRVTSRSGTGTVTTNEVVGTETLHGPDGSMKTVDVHGDVTRNFDWHDYSFSQGTAQIDEQDFYRLAGDRASEQRVRAYRKGGVKLQKIGLAIIAGAVLVGGGLTTLGIANDSVGLALGGTIGGLVLIAPGAALYGGGRGRMDDKVVPEDTAIEAADQVVRCFNDECGAPHPGGRKFRDGAAVDGDVASDSEGSVDTPRDARLPSLAIAPRPPAPRMGMRPALEPQRGPTSVVGAWHGTVTTTISQPGQTPSKQSDEVTFEIESAANGTVVFWPNADQKEPRCRFVATIEGSRATFFAKKVCTIAQDGAATTLTVRSGSLELRGDRLQLELVIAVSSRGKRGSTTGRIVYTGVGRHVP